MGEEKPRKRARRSWKKKERKRTREEENENTGDKQADEAPNCSHHQRSGDLRELGSPQDCSLHPCKRKKGTDQEEDRDEEKIRKEEDMYSAGTKWTKRKGIWVKNFTGQEKEAREIDPDLASQYNEGSKTKKRMDWIQVNGNWIKNPEKDPDIPPDTLEEGPDIPKNKKRAEEIMTILPRKRLRKKYNA